MRKYLFGFLLIVSSFVVWATYTNIHTSKHPPALSKREFDTSIGIHRLGRRFVLHRGTDKRLHQRARQLIDLRSRDWEQGIRSKIPRIIHQVWPHTYAMPDELLRSVKTVINSHKEYTYMLWRPEDFGELIEHVFGDNWRELPANTIRDLVAATVLWRFGGVIFDPEVECLQNMDHLFQLGDFIVGLEPPLPQRVSQRRLMLSPSVLAATAGHTLTKDWLMEMISRLKTPGLTPCHFNSWISQETLTNTLVEQGLSSGRPLIVGPTFFVPLSPKNISNFVKNIEGTKKTPLSQRILSLFGFSSKPFSSITQETVCIHMAGGRCTVDEKTQLSANTQMKNTQKEKSTLVTKQKETPSTPTA